MCETELPLVFEDSRVLAAATTDELQPFLDAGEPLPSIERAGPRRDIYFDPAQVGCGIVTCGGLCPGLNDVIRSIVLTLWHQYGVKQIVGFRYGYAGLSADPPEPAIALTPEVVRDIHHDGGTMLGSSRGAQDLTQMVETCKQNGINILFTIGGDGTLRGAAAVAEQAEKMGYELAVIGVPKTIDNDLMWVERSFGFATAVEEARQSIASAHAEARGAWNGIGLIKLMGRHSGFIAAHACLANSDANFCLVPEVPFELDGTHGLLEAVAHRLRQRHHAVIVVAEGAAQDILQDPSNVRRDKSGNVKLVDVGPFLKQRILEHCSIAGLETTLKYIDPSYIIRSIPANAMDSEFCLALGQSAVHAGMAGRTQTLIGFLNRHFVHLPLELATRGRRQIDPNGELWHRVVQATGQPALRSSPC